MGSSYQAEPNPLSCNAFQYLPQNQVGQNITQHWGTVHAPEDNVRHEEVFEQVAIPGYEDSLERNKLRKGGTALSFESSSGGGKSWWDGQKNKSSFFYCMYGNIIRMLVLLIREPVSNLLEFSLPILGAILIIKFFLPIILSVHSHPSGSSDEVRKSGQILVSYERNVKIAQICVSTLFTGSMIIFSLQVTRRLVAEKEMQLREIMSIMGLSETVRYTSWIVVHAIKCGIISVVCACVFKFTYLRGLNYFYISSLFFLFTMSLTSLFGLVAAFFESTTLALIFATLGHMVLIIAPLFVNDAIINNISPASRFAHDISILIVCDTDPLSMPQVSSPSSFAQNTCLVLFCQFCVYLLLMLYFDAILPRKWGVRKSLLFFILDPLRACCYMVRDVVFDNNPEDGRFVDGVFEPMREAASYSVRIVGFTKEFKRGKRKFRAVNSLHWALQEGEISVLLGQNGSGKTTLMNMIIGMVNPNAGDCYVYGHSVRNELSRVREMVGYCPQKSILWPNLTCWEHLKFYATIRGLRGARCEATIEKMLRSIGLKEKENCLAHHLSGGQKRKLSVLIAFVAGTRFVILDEPTAGVDALARRQLWDLMRSIAPQCTLLLSTHFMDEADMLGDSVAIIKEGRLRCAGSSMFLKSRLGVGFVLTVPLDLKKEHQRLVDLVRLYEPNAKLVSIFPHELSFGLPMSARKVFPELLAEIENRGEELGAAPGYNVNPTTLEQIFLRVTEGEDDLKKSGLVAQKQTQVVECELGQGSFQQALSDIFDVKMLRSGFSITMSGLRAMLQKKLLINLRCRSIPILQFIFPILSMLLVGIFYRTKGPGSSSSQEGDERESWNFFVFVSFVLLLSFIPPPFISPIVREGINKTRHMQKLYGLHYFVYWFSNFIFDFMSYIVCVTTIVILLAVVGVEAYHPPSGRLVVLWLLYGSSSISMTYALSFFFKSHLTALIMVSVLSVILCVITALLSLAQLFLKLPPTVIVIKWILRIFPVSCFTEGFMYLHLELFLPNPDAFSYQKTILLDKLFMALETVLFILITFLLDNRNVLYNLFWRPKPKSQALDPGILESDVLKEQEEVVHSPERFNDPVRAQHLYKVYNNGNVAIRNLTFGVKSEEVLALLGINGSGKTTTISMLCQDLQPTKGKISIFGRDTVRESQKALRGVGCCPQFDVIFKELTVEEHLWLYAGVRGIDYAMRRRAVKSVMDCCDLTTYRNVKPTKLSGGNQRKLSVAISLLGRPHVLLLDEPSAGLDPRARHRLWSLIKALTSRCAVLLTTHHLDEVEELAHRVAIMVSGRLSCIGTKSHLKNKYGSGFQVKIRVEKDTDAFRATVMDFFKEVFPQCNLSEEHGIYYTYDLAPDTKLSLVFKHLEKNMDRLGVTDYTVSPKTVEKVFMHISNRAEP